jgi:hypothetical protein
MYLFKKKGTSHYIEAYVFDNETDRAAAENDCNGTRDSENGTCAQPGTQCAVQESDLTVACCE